MIDDGEPTRLGASLDEPALLREALAGARNDRPGYEDPARLGASAGVAIVPTLAAVTAPPASTLASSVTSGTAWWTGVSAKIGLCAILVVGGGAAWWAA